MTVEELSTLVKSKSNPVIINKSIGTLPLLGIAFIVLKLIGTITWSWWWVLAPFWGPICLAALLVLVGIVIIVIAAYKTVDKEADKEVKEETKEDVKKEPEAKKGAPKKVTRKRKPKSTKEDGGTEGKNE